MEYHVMEPLHHQDGGIPAGPLLFSIWSTIPEGHSRILTKEDVHMARIEESIEIKAPVEKVFGITTDASRWSTWHTARRLILCAPMIVGNGSR
jgi:hypothetical protein